MRALRGGDVQTIFETLAPVIPQAKAGTVKVLGVTAKGNTPEQMQALLVRDIQWWREVIGKAKIDKQ